MMEAVKGRISKLTNDISIPNRTMVQFGAGAVISLLLMSWLRIRPLGVLFLGLLGFWLYQTRCNLRIVAPPELQRKFKNVVDRIRFYRQTQPSSFCAVASICLMALAILGHVISGSTVVLVGLIIAAIVSTKYNFKIVKLDSKDFEWSSKIQADLVDLDEEFLPEANENNLCVLQRASDLATLSSPTEIEGEDEEKSDEVPSEFLIEEVPEVNENTSDEDNVDDLLPIVRGIQGQEAILESNYHVKNLSLSNKDAIQFKKRHFKDDASSLIDTTSSSEESLSKGLVFPDHTTIDGPAKSSQPHNLVASDIIATAVKAGTQELIANSGKIIPNLVSSLVQWGSGNSGSATANTEAISNTGNSSQSNRSSKTSGNRRIVTALDSSDDSDFEILENDDFK